MSLATTPPTAGAIAAAILKTPANLLGTDASGDVTYNNAAPPTAAAIATATAADILASPTHLLATDASGFVTYNNAAPLTSTQTAQAVLNATASSYDTAGTIGAKINSGGGGGSDAWDELTSAHTTEGTFGRLVQAGK